MSSCYQWVLLRSAQGALWKDLHANNGGYKPPSKAAALSRSYLGGVEPLIPIKHSPACSRLSRYHGEVISTCGYSSSCSGARRQNTGRRHGTGRRRHIGTAVWITVHRKTAARPITNTDTTALWRHLPTSAQRWRHRWVVRRIRERIVAVGHLFPRVETFTRRWCGPEGRQRRW